MRNLEKIAKEIHKVLDEIEKLNFIFESSFNENTSIESLMESLNRVTQDCILARENFNTAENRFHEISNETDKLQEMSDRLQLDCEVLGKKKELLKEGQEQSSLRLVETDQKKKDSLSDLQEKKQQLANFQEDVKVLKGEIESANSDFAEIRERMKGMISRQIQMQSPRRLAANSSRFFPTPRVSNDHSTLVGETASLNSIN